MMKSLEELYKRALELKNKGMSDKEISTELHLSVNTVTWLLSKEFLKEKVVQDVKIGWRSLGVYGGRIAHVAEIMADIIEEESRLSQFEVDSILGITINGIPFATMVSYIMDRELIVYRPHPARKEGLFSSNYAGVRGKNIVVIDDVASTGETLRRTFKDVRDEGGKVVLAVLLASKLPVDEIDGVKIRSILRTRLVGPEG
ncbi:orotate phosphoribosyltransferase [Thermogymnomonas acidicola]|uniref:Transcriptional regulator GfcR n=1 Tax=Thermogymnomonas acidicola TaxID=399579 RepID=A0AA37BQ21_9ARCH|nr:orotate phosphoribosyltransferase-like protein [Thermogymnomonas acidicola]GGM68035.1 orotate phosphoribosyltransferase [Thermogymnomonas acidicola]